ncbi:MAG: Crp/Fnr family transcriptional regulator [Zoogloeaceae bacterium]|nr:Crp/Fnr family transcriptional regulator [Zoogloeaceae bacterium]
MSGSTDCDECPLRRHAGFQSNSPAELAFIQEFRERERSIGAGMPILREGDTSDRLFTLRAGWAFRHRTLPDGRRQILNFLLPGDFIGLQSEISGRSPHGVEALTSVRLCEFSRDGLWELYRRFPSLGYDITWLASHEEWIVDENLLTTGRRSAMERVAMILVHLARRAESVGEGGSEGIVFPLTQQHLADALGLSLVHTNKTLRRLQALGLHEMAGGRLRLRDPRALQRIAEYYAQPLKSRPLI